MGDRLPEVIDFERLTSRPDVIIDFANETCALFIFDQRGNRRVPQKKFGSVSVKRHVEFGSVLKKRERDCTILWNQREF